MKIGTKVTWQASGGRNGGKIDRTGEVVAKVKPNEDAKTVFKASVKDVPVGALRLNATQLTSSHERVIVKVDDSTYVCPRVDKVTAVVSNSPTLKSTPPKP